MSDENQGFREREFKVAMSIFVIGSILGTIFALWYIHSLATSHEQTQIQAQD